MWLTESPSRCARSRWNSAHEEEGEKEETGEDDEIMSVENNSLSDVSDLELEELSED